LGEQLEKGPGRKKGMLIALKSDKVSSACARGKLRKKGGGTGSGMGKRH